MQSKAKKLAALVPEDLYPQGSFRGLWGGYEASFLHGGFRFVVETETGVRGHDIPVSIQIQGTKIMVKEL